MQQTWYDINDPGFTFAAKAAQPREEAVDLVDEAPPEPQAAPAAYRLKSARWKEGPEGFAFNKKCTVVVEGAFSGDPVGGRVRGELWCESDAGVEDLKSYPEGALDKNGTAELEVTLYIADGYYRLTGDDPNAKCRYTLKRLSHPRGDKEIESEALEMPRTEVRGLGGIWIRLVDESGAAVTDREVLVRTDSETLREGPMPEGEWKVDDKPASCFTVEISGRDRPIELEVPWQRSPLIEQAILLGALNTEQSDG